MKVQQKVSHSKDSSSDKRKKLKGKKRGKEDKSIHAEASSYNAVPRVSMRLVEKRSAIESDVCKGEGKTMYQISDLLNASKVIDKNEASTKVKNPKSVQKCSKLSTRGTPLQKPPPLAKKARVHSPSTNNVKNHAGSSTTSSQNRGSSVNNVDPIVLKSLGEGLNETGKEKLKEIVSEFDPKVIVGLFSKLTQLYSENRDTQIKHSETIPTVTTANEASKKDACETVQLSLKEENSKSSIESTSNSQQMASSSMSDTSSSLSFPGAYSPYNPYSYQPPWFMMPHLYYNQMFNMYPNMGPFPNGFMYNGMVPTSSSGYAASEQNTLQQGDANSKAELVTGSSATLKDPSHHTTITTDSNVEKDAQIFTEASKSEDKDNQQIKESFISSRNTSLDFLQSVERPTAAAVTVLKEKRIKESGMYENTDIGVKPLKDTCVDLKNVVQDSQTVEDERQSEPTLEKKQSLEKDIDVVRTSDSEDSDASAEFQPPESIQNVYKKNKEDEEIPPTETLSRFLQSENGETTSFLGFCDQINDPKQNVLEGVENENKLQESVEKSKETSIQSSVITSTAIKEHKEDPSMKEKTDVITIEDDEEDENEDEVAEGKTYQNLTSMKGPMREQGNLLVKNSRNIPVPKMLAALSTLPHGERTRIFPGNKIRLTPEKFRHLASKNISETVEINSALHNLLETSKQGGLRLPKRLTDDVEHSTSNERQKLDKSVQQVTKEKKRIETVHTAQTNESKKYVDQSTWFRECSKNLYLQDQDGDTILHIAIAKEDVSKSNDIIKRMRGFRLDIMNALGQTALHMALYVHQIDIVKMLLYNGADVSIVDGHGNSVLQIACEEDSFELVQCLFEFSPGYRDKFITMMERHNNQGLSAIHIATKNQNKDILELLVKHGADLNIQEEKSGTTAIVMAAQRSNWDLVEFYLDHGANVNIPAYSGYYVLHFAVQASNIKMVRSLLARGAEIGSKSTDCDPASLANYEIKMMLDKEMRRRRRKRHQDNQKSACNWQV